MSTFIDEIKRFLNRGGMLAVLLSINIGLFLLIRLASVFFVLFNIGPEPFIQYLQLPSDPTLLLYRPWTLITYMFTHYDVLHILFNMLWLYWFGKIFLNFFNEKQLFGLYLLGGIGGALLFMLAYNTLPYFTAQMRTGMLMGASASVMAIVFAVSFYKKDFEIRLLFFGRIKLIYLALVTFLIDLLALTSANAGGHIAHIGGALLGIFYASRMLKGKDFTKGINTLIDKVANLGKKKKPKMKVTYTRAETDMEYRERKNEEVKNIDNILDKLKHSGYESLSKEEKEQLFNASKK